jgi:hypothetical protein
MKEPVTDSTASDVSLERNGFIQRPPRPTFEGCAFSAIDRWTSRTEALGASDAEEVARRVE